MVKKAFELFERYRQELDGEFHSKESVRAAQEKCIAIVKELYELGLLLLLRSKTTIEKLTLPNSEERMLATINFFLILVPLSPADPTPIA